LYHTAWEKGVCIVGACWSSMSLLPNIPFRDVVFSLYQKRFMRNFGVGWSSEGFSATMFDHHEVVSDLDPFYVGSDWGGLCGADRAGI
jgi:hypothetical protein